MAGGALGPWPVRRLLGEEVLPQRGLVHRHPAAEAGALLGHRLRGLELNGVEPLQAGVCVSRATDVKPSNAGGKVVGWVCPQGLGTGHSLPLPTCSGGWIPFHSIPIILIYYNMCVNM